MTLKILHFADTHVIDKDLKEIDKCLSSLIETAGTERPDVIVCAGDVTESQNIKMDSPSAKLIFNKFKILADIAPIVIVKGTPSHEGTASQILEYVNAKHQIWFSVRPQMLYIADGMIWDSLPIKPEACDIDAVISTVPTPTKQFFTGDDSGVVQSDEDISKAMTGIFAGFGELASHFPEVPHILAGHFQVGGAYVSDTQQLTGVDIEISKDQIALANADVVCLGHIHKAQKIGDNIFYSGSIYRKNFGEMEDKGFFLHEIGRRDVIPNKLEDFEENFKTADEYMLLLRGGCIVLKSRFVKTPSRKLVKIEIDLTQDEKVFDIPDLNVLYKNTPDEIDDAFVRVIFTVFQNDVEKIDSKAVKKTLIETGVSGAQDVDIQRVIIPRENVRSEKILTLETLDDKIIEMARLKDETVPDSIIEKAKILETDTHDDIVKHVRG